MLPLFRWQPLGKLFDPALQPVLGRQVTYSQSPQAIDTGDCVRIYFTCRFRDTASTFISLPAFVDFDRKLTSPLEVASRPLLSPAKLGAFDEHGIFPFSPATIGGEIHAFTTGWSRRKSVSVETGIGLVKSDDGGTTFKRTGPGPVLTASLHEPYLVADAFVRAFNGAYHMWYIYGTRWQSYPDSPQPERTYKIAHALSKDGFTWQKDEAREQLISDCLGENECQALPSVIYHGGLYHMVFCFRETTGFRNIPTRGYHLGYAWSKDLKKWERNDALLNISSQGNWDNETMSYPNFFACDGHLYLFYCGNNFGERGFGGFRLLET